LEKSGRSDEEDEADNERYGRSKAEREWEIIEPGGMHRESEWRELKMRPILTSTAFLRLHLINIDARALTFASSWFLRAP
jgi:hypothetical protein